MEAREASCGESALKKSSILRKLFEEKDLVRIMGAHNGLSAKLAEEAGFDGIWASGLEISTAAAVPDAFAAVHVVVRAVDGLVVAGMIEDEELQFRPEAGCIGDPAFFQIRLALASDGPRVPAVFLEIKRAFDVAD